MKCDLSKEKLVGFFYEDLPDEAIKDVKLHLKKCAACKKELAEFSKTADILKTWPDEEPGLNLKFIREKASFRNWLKSGWSVGFGWRKVAVGFAGGFALVMLILSVLNFEASYSDGELNVKLTLLPRSEKQAEITGDPLAVPITKREFDSWKEDSYLVIQDMIERTQTHSRNEYRTALREFARDVDYQRRQDLSWVGKGFEVVHSTNDDKLRRTNQVLQQLIQRANFQSVRPNTEQNK